MKQIPKIAFINLDIELDLEKWLTEDDKESILDNAKNQSDIETYLYRLIADNIDTIISYKSIDIDFK